MGLAEEIREQILAIPEIGHEIHLEWLPAVEQAFAASELNAAIHPFQGQIANETLLGLRVCSDILRRHAPEPALDEKQLADLLAEVRALIDDILKASLPPDLRRFLLERLRDIASAIEEYRLFGRKPIEEALGALVVTGAKISEKVEPAQDGLLKRVRKVAGTLIILLQLAKSGTELADSVIKLIPDTPGEVIDIPPLRTLPSDVETRDGSVVA